MIVFVLFVCLVSTVITAFLATKFSKSKVFGKSVLLVFIIIIFFFVYVWASLLTPLSRSLCIVSVCARLLAVDVLLRLTLQAFFLN